MTTQTASATTMYIPTPLRGFTENQSSVEVTGATVAEALGALVTRYPGLRDHLYDGEGTLRSFVNLYKNDDDVRYLEGVATPLEAGDTLSIVPSIAGGV
jgi:molybdopterin converting factor small subunit